MRQQCGSCGRPYALTFERCPACGTPAGSKERAPRVPDAPAEEPALRLELDEAEAPPIPELDLTPIELEAPRPTPELEPEPPRPWPAQALAPQAPPPAPSPVAGLPPRFAARPPAFDSTAVTFARIITWLGVACVFLGLLPVGCWRAFYSFEKTEVSALGDVKTGKRVELTDGIADWNNATVVDLDSPTEVGDPRELRRRESSLKGKLVSLDAAPLGAYMYKQYRIDASGQRVEIPGVTRVYLPLSLDNSAWAVSGLVRATSFDDPEVKAELERTRHTGVLQRLADNVNLEDMRHPDHTSGPVLARAPIPDDALAIVHVQRSDENRKYTVARIVGTKGRYVAVTTDVKPSAEESLFGELQRCPSKTCESFAATLPDEPVAVVVLTTERGFPWKTEVALFMLLGLAGAIGGFRLTRKLQD